MIETMNILEKIVHDYILDCYNNKQSKVLEKDTFHDWWIKNRDKYNNELETVFLESVKETMFDIAFDSQNIADKN